MPSHLLQVRSVVALGTFVTWLPGAQVVQARHLNARSNSAYASAGHGVHAVELSAPANWPALHSWQDADASPFENVPFGHSSGPVAPGRCWKEPGEVLLQLTELLNC